MQGTSVRIKYSKLGKIRFLGHRDLARVWERALRRTGLPLQYTHGFSPHPKLEFGLALPLGWESTAEYLDIRLVDAVELADVNSRLEAVLPEGISVLASGPVVRDERSLSELVEVAEYWVLVAVNGPGPPERPAGQPGLDDEFWSSVREVMARDSVIAAITRKGEQVEADIRPMIVSVERGEYEDGSPMPCYPEGALSVAMRLRTRPYVLRPEAVLRALGGESLWRAVRVRRIAQFWLEEGRLVSIDATIGSWGSAG